MASKRSAIVTTVYGYGVLHMQAGRQAGRQAERLLRQRGQAGRQAGWFTKSTWRKMTYGNYFPCRVYYPIF
jgi:hypothetical protein